MARTSTFGQKLAAGFAVVVLLTLAMGAVGFYTLRSVVASKDRVIRHSDQNLIDAEVLRASMQKEVANVRGFLLTAEPRFADSIRAANQEFKTTLAKISDRGVSSDDQRIVANIREAEAAHQVEVERVLTKRSNQEDLASIISIFEQRVIPNFDRLGDTVTELIASNQSEREEVRQQANDVASNAIAILIAFALASLVFAIAIAYLLTRTLSRQIGGSVQHIRSSSAELQAAATQQATGAKEQASAMTEIGTTIGELLATSRQIAESGKHVASMAADSAASAGSGGEAVETARSAVGSIKQQVDMIVSHMLDLGKKSQRVGGILEIINELSEQTNILAINATIEAAGAGEAGRRFAVVGEEIRKLADRVGGSTKEIRALIDEIRAAVNATVMATETGSKTVEAGTERFVELEAAFARIGDLVSSTMEAGREIELSTKQQATAVEQVNAAISNVAQATKETEASSGQTLQTASQLASLSDDLGRLVQSQ